MQLQHNGWMSGLYQAQVESAQNLTSASMEGFERIQQVTMQAVRQQFDDQLRLINAISTRSAEAIVDPEVARPAFERMFDVQRQLTDAIVRTNQRVLFAVTSTAQRGADAVTQAGERRDAEEVSALFESALQQWQELAQRMFNVFQQQLASIANESGRQGALAIEQGAQALQGAARAMQVEAAGERSQGEPARAPKPAEREEEVA